MSGGRKPSLKARRQIPHRLLGHHRLQIRNNSPPATRCPGSQFAHLSWLCPPLCWHAYTFGLLYGTIRAVPHRAARCPGSQFAHLSWLCPPLCWHAYTFGLLYGTIRTVPHRAALDAGLEWRRIYFSALFCVSFNNLLKTEKVIMIVRNPRHIRCTASWKQ